MAYAKCFDCGWNRDDIKTKTEAQKLATLHYRLSPKGCLLSFGYNSKEEAKTKSW